MPKPLAIWTCVWPVASMKIRTASASRRTDSPFLAFWAAFCGRSLVGFCDLGILQNMRCLSSNLLVSVDFCLSFPAPLPPPPTPLYSRFRFLIGTGTAAVDSGAGNLSSSAARGHRKGPGLPRNPSALMRVCRGLPSVAAPLPPIADPSVSLPGPLEHGQHTRPGPHRSGDPLRAESLVVEPQDAALRLRQAQRHPHHRHQGNRQGAAPGQEVHRQGG